MQRRWRPALRQVAKGLTQLLPNAAVEAVRTRAFALPADEVVRLTTALGAAKVRFWALGGWGVDALLGQQTRPHADLDLAVLDLCIDRAVEVLTRLGYASVEHRQETSLLLPYRVVLRHDCGWTVDVLPVRVTSVDDKSVETSRSGDWAALAAAGHLAHIGEIAGMAVPCVSAELQQILRRGYSPRARDRRDATTLASLGSDGRRQ